MFFCFFLLILSHSNERFTLETFSCIYSLIKDIAKLTIHWLKDIYSTCQVVEAINELLKIFSMFWRKHVEFTLNLLDNLTTELYILKEVR